MDEKQTTAELVEATEKETQGHMEEASYILPSHPEAVFPLSKESISLEEPIVAKDSVYDLIQQAVNGLRGELRAELETQATKIQADLYTELWSERQKMQGD